MTMVRVELRITGLCGFVQRPDGSEMRVVLGNARDLIVGGHHGTHAPHEALLLVEKANLPSSPSIDRSFGFDYRDYEIGTYIPVSAYRLSGVDLSFTEPVVAGFTTTNRHGAYCPGDQTAFDWIVSMSEVDAARIKRDAVVGKDVGLVLGRFSLKGGTLTTEAIRTLPFSGGGYEYLKWEFKDDAGNTKPNPRALADKVKLQFDVDVDWSNDNGWGIDFSYFNGGSGTLFLEPGSGNLIRIWLLNMPLLNVLDIFSGKPDDPEVHFIHHYSLSELSGASPTYIPYSAGTCPPGTGGLTGPKCPPVMYDSLADDWQ